MDTDVYQNSKYMKISDILDTKLAASGYLRPNYPQAIFVINK